MGEISRGVGRAGAGEGNRRLVRRSSALNAAAADIAIGMLNQVGLAAREWPPEPMHLVLSIYDNQHKSHIDYILTLLSLGDIVLAMDYPIHFADQLKQHLRSLRKARGMTQARLAQALGTTQSRVAHIEADPTAVSFDQLFQVLSSLGVDVVLRDRSPSQVEKSAAHPGDGPGTPKSTEDDW